MEEAPPPLLDDRVQEEARPEIEPNPSADTVPEVPHRCNFSEDQLQADLRPEKGCC
jgi:hypothetical protein